MTSITCGPRRAIAIRAGSLLAASVSTATTARAHHAGESETLLEAIGDHIAENALAAAALAVVLIAGTVLLLRRRDRGAGPRGDGA